MSLATAPDDQQVPNPSPTVDAPRGETSSHATTSPATATESAGASASATTSEPSTESLRMAATSNEPPLPYEDAPPLPEEAPPSDDDDGWEPRWDATAQTWYFYNKKTGVTQWENPRVPDAPIYNNHRQYDRFANFLSFHLYFPDLIRELFRNFNPGAASSTTNVGAPGTSSPPKRKWGGYNPAIHGSYDPNADYAREATKEEEEEEEAAAAAAAAAVGLPNPASSSYTAQANFNRFTGKFQAPGSGPEMHNDENKSKRQMSAFFDVDAAANSHDGRSLKAERRGKTLSKKELKAFKEKRHLKKEEKRRAWLRD